MSDPFSAAALATGAGDGRRAPILVVSPDSAMGAYLARLIQGQGEQAVSVDSLVAALQRVAHLQPPVIVVDGSTMADHGRAALHALRHSGAAGHVIVMMAQARQSEVLALARAGAREVLLVPVDPARLGQTIQALLAPPTQRQHARRAVQVPARIGFGARPGTPYACMIEDISVGGARCTIAPGSSAAAPLVGTFSQLLVQLPGADEELLLLGRVVRNIGSDGVALSFLHLSESAAQRIAAMGQHMDEERRCGAAQTDAGSRPSHDDHSARRQR